MEEFLLTPYALAIISILGMFSHFFKKKIKGESFSDITGYFKDHVRTTLLAWIATAVGFVAYYTQLKTGMNADIFACFGIGYLSDSMFNKFDSKDYPVEK